ncbi:hypothetical protein D9757_005642 [Collybiopsis confluens]|uniref:Glucose receptor Git3 N-terminal domain-containing protein n=1 Tax=Collybiopsis confluens TaxID=2823264 RepID=A0A8H5HTD7_9AGAR|nr:hypothetical protein D9757_005642 [Collybiopsis confluens]
MSADELASSNYTSIKLPNGEQFLTSLAYTPKELSGVTFLLVVSSLSLGAVIGLLAIISLSAFRTRQYKSEEHLFVRTHVAAYFLSLLVCDLIQSIGSLYNTRWVLLGAVTFDNFCIAQGVLKQMADVGTALWTFIIALHTFCLLVLEVKPNRFTLLATLTAGWFGIFAIVISGPAVLDTVSRGPFFGISGYWCWISDGYQTPRITLDYLFMFLAALLCFVLHGLIHLRLSGHLSVNHWRMSFHKQALERPVGRLFDDKGMSIAKQMLLYPIAYSVIILPIAVSRFTAWSGHKVSFEGTVFCEAVFLLSGIVNVTLFCTCRQILPPESVVLLKRSISKPKPIEDSPVPDNASQDSDPYYAASETVIGYGFSEKYKEYGQDVAADLERGSTLHRASVVTSESSSAISIPYEHTVAPLQIRKTLRHPRPPSVIVPVRRINSLGEVEEIDYLPSPHDPGGSNDGNRARSSFR